MNTRTRTRTNETITWHRVMSGVQEGRFVEGVRYARTGKMGLLWLFRDAENGRWRIRGEEEIATIEGVRVNSRGVVMDQVGPVTFGWTMAEAKENVSVWLNEGRFPARW